ncbi:MAG TPA: SCO family protein [Candidatus Acidoferrales bacterium]|jgi:protein SCO1/2|nr:SCO family protein [Candidatus Acidoferrales bacterium]
MRRKTLAAAVAVFVTRFRSGFPMAFVTAGILLSFAPASAASWGANYFPNIPLTTQDGKTVHLYDDLLKDKKVVINFIYTRCGDSCPLETARLAQVQRILGDRMGRDIFFYSFSVDPVRDTPEELKAYAAKYHAGPGWLFLTGKKADIDIVRKKVGLAAHADENEITDHSTSIMIGNTASGQWIRDSSMDNAQYIAVIIRDWLSSWTDRAPGSGYGGQSYAEKRPLPASAADKGTYLFQTRCSACHTIGEGDGLGPDLLGVTTVRKPDWLAGMIAAPNEMLSKKDPVATALFARFKEVRMPNLRLGEVDVNALIGFLKAQDAAHEGGHRKAAAVGAAPDVPGKPAQ